ncbi:DNA translocase FtsK [Candidatus Latescibacterota bacterium]
MAKNSNSKLKKGKSRLREILGILVICGALFLLVALVTHDPGDWPNSSMEFGEPSHNKAGRLGAVCSHWMLSVLGFTSYAVLALAILGGVVIFLHERLLTLLKPAILFIILGLFLPLLVALTVDIGSDNTLAIPAFSYGGVLGGLLANLMITGLGRLGAYIVSLAAVLVALVFSTKLKPSTMVDFMIACVKWIAMIVARVAKVTVIRKTATRQRKPSTYPPQSSRVDTITDEYEEPFLTPVEEEEPVEPAQPAEEPTINYKEKQTPLPGNKYAETSADYERRTAYLKEDESIGAFPGEEEETVQREFILPSIDLLDVPEHDPLPESREEMIEKSRHIVESLRHFNIDAEVRQITPGPIVTRYELTLAPGVKVGRVVSLSDDLAMALKAKGPIRIIAPIPGKAAIGIEVPNKKRATVYLREIVDSETFLTADKLLVLALGKNTAGEPVIADLAKMPHLLIAGSTGSGKSVCIHTLIASILLKAPPDMVRVLMIDPKVVELTIYNSIPHLLTPVVIDPGRAADALKWAVREMESRYRQIAFLGVRDITQYNAKIDTMAEEENKEIPKPLPFIIIIIDEFADLMVVSSAEIEESIARLAQMARAVGVHLVLATQRPSADVITGIIKANFPSRIAFKVMQASNSRIILDQNGADKLLGMGDMLFLQVGKPEPVRLHGAYISGEESNRLVGFVSSQPRQGIETITEEIFKEEEAYDDNVLGLRDPYTRDSLFFKAARLVVRNNQGSVSLLQRRLKIGYARAARLIDQLELASIVSPYDGSKAREVLVDNLYIDQLEAGEL